MKYVLKERIYSSGDNEEENFSQLEKFFQEFASRKRGKTFAEGLNGGIIIKPTKWAAKVNEDDGKAYHVHTNMNLVRFLNGELEHFETEIKAGRYALSKDETQAIIKEDIVVSLLSDRDNCRIIMFCYNNRHSKFQISTLKMILRIAQDISKEYSDCLEIGFFDSEENIESDSLTQEQQEKIENYLNQYQINGPKQLIKSRRNQKGKY